MACERPRRIINRRYKDMLRPHLYEYSQLHFGTFYPPDYEVDVPCGRCASCKRRELADYRIRLLYECARPIPSHSLNLFVTLTFDDENLRTFSRDPNRAVRLFLDRMRKRYGKQVRHWFVGEFGTKNGRPHYHGILFNVPDRLSNSAFGPHPGQHLELEDVWSYGFVFVGYCNEKTAGYITKYLTKDLNGRKVRPRIISSFGIGDNYLTLENIALHKVDGGQPFISQNSYIYALPRYYSNKIFTDFEKQNMAFERFLNPSITWRWNGKKYSNPFDFNSARLVTYVSNVRSGLTSTVDPPKRPRGLSYEEKFLKHIFENEDSIINDFENLKL